MARKLGVSEGAIYAWKAKFGGMSVSDAQRLPALEDENRRLKSLPANDELLAKKWRGPSPCAKESLINGRCSSSASGAPAPS